jgi:hypothetical protein
VHLNDESIRTEVAVETEHEHSDSGMMFAHDDDDDNESDELSAADRALIASANREVGLSRHPEPAKQAKPSSSMMETGMATRNVHLQHNSAKDELSPAEKALVSGAEEGFDKGFKNSAAVGHKAAAVTTAEKFMQNVVVKPRKADVATPALSASDLQAAMDKITKSATLAAVNSVVHKGKKKSEASVAEAATKTWGTPVAPKSKARAKAEEDLASVERSGNQASDRSDDVFPVHHADKALGHLSVDAAKKFMQNVVVKHHTALVAKKGAHVPVAAEKTLPESAEKTETAEKIVKAKAKPAWGLPDAAPAPKFITPAEQQKSFAQKLAEADQKAQEQATKLSKPLTEVEIKRADKMMSLLRDEEAHKREGIFTHAF